MIPSVVFDSVWKKFRRGERHDSLRDLIPSLVGRAFRTRPADALLEQEFWALRDVSFEVAPGEALGIIGSNGAGKSTVLKLLSKILKPTRGACAVRGRVGALIEVAAGFHPDLTGRENIYVQGAIMGMSRADIARRFDAIVDFAGIEAFVDTQVKRYSSGMNARLGFAIAAHLSPQVLLIDEVLAVGDMQFQRKCEARMKRFRDEGVALVFVSHNLHAVAQLCGQSLLLDRGCVARLGPTAETIGAYCQNTRSASADGATIEATFHPPAGDDGLSALRPGTRVTVDVDVEFHRNADHATVGLVVWDAARNEYVYGASSDAIGIPLVRARAGDRVSLRLSFILNLTRGVYTVELNVVDGHQFLAVARGMRYFTIAEQVSYDGIANLYLTGSAVAGQRERCAS